MRYEITLHKTLSRTVQIEAANPSEACDRARIQNKGYQAASVWRLEEGELEEEHVLNATCEHCDKHLWDEETGVCDTEGVTVCNACMKEFVESQKPKSA